MTALSDHDTTVQVPTVPARGQFQAGDIVNITMTGVTIADADAFGIDVNFGPDEGGSWFAGRVPFGPTSIAIERALPANWPPQRGDVWIDRHGDPWFGVHIDDCTYLVGETGSDQYIQSVAGSHGPLTLAFRDGKAVQS